MSRRRIIIVGVTDEEDEKNETVKYEHGIPGITVYGDSCFGSLLFRVRVNVMLCYRVRLG